MNLKTDNQRGLTIAQGPHSIFYNNLYGKRIQKRMDICITKSLCFKPETNTTL